MDKETSHGINLCSASVYLFEVTSFYWGRGKMEKSPHSKNIKHGVDFFPFFPFHHPLVCHLEG
jgi:hypothetical protein